MICVSIGRTRHKMMIAEHRALAERGAELVELRLDWLSHTPDLARLLKDRPTPVVVTCRREADKGHWKGTEEQRQTLLRAAVVAGVDYVDIEDDIASQFRRYGPTRRIISHHDFEDTPRDLEKIHARMCELDPDIIKLVTMAHSPADGLRMLKLVSQSKIPTIGFCMGELGVYTRILTGKFGAPFSYATFNKDRELAPGQLSFDEMKNVYRYDDIGPNTAIYGVIGDPIGHSMSPLIHNAAYRVMGMDKVYVPFRVPKDALNHTLDQFSWLDVKGYSVTLPHKEAILSRVTQFDGPAMEIGAANTLYADEDGSWWAANSDYDAALESLQLGLQSAINARQSSEASGLAGKRTLMLGAGGVARAIGLGLVRAGARLTIANRSHDRAAALAAHLGCQQTHWENRASVHPEILVNCTPVGMHPDLDESPFAEHWLQDGMVVFDTIYNPEQTLLIKEAKQRNCHVVTGVEMFVRQAAVQFERFTGHAAPLEVMRAALRRGISAVG